MVHGNTVERRHEIKLQWDLLWMVCGRSYLGACCTFFVQGQFEKSEVVRSLSTDLSSARTLHVIDLEEAFPLETEMKLSRVGMASRNY